MSEPVDGEYVAVAAAGIMKRNPLPAKLERALEDVPGVDALCGPDPELDSLLDVEGSESDNLGSRLFAKAFLLYFEARQIGPRSPEFLNLYARAARAAEAASRAFTRVGATGKEWARAREAAAIGLRVLGDQNLDDEQCVQLLSRAAEAGEEAAKAFSERDCPEDWANSQNELAETLILLAAYTDENALALGHLKRAIELCEAALRYRTRPRDPKEWAVTQYQLADALQKCSCHVEHDEARVMLERAAKIHEETFDALDRKADSALWCDAHVLIGSVRKMQGELESGGKSRRMYAQSAAAFKTASRCISKENQPIRWGRNQLVIATIQLELARLSSEDAAARHRSAAVAACESAMKIFDAEDFPEDWIELHGYLWPTLYHLAISSKGKKSLRLLSRSAEACEEAIRVSSPRSAPEELGTERMGLAKILSTLAEVAPNAEVAMRHGRRAMEIYEAEVDLIDREGGADDRVQLRQELSLLATVMATRCDDDENMAPLLAKAADTCEEGIRLCTPEMIGLRRNMERVLVEIRELLADMADS